MAVQLLERPGAFVATAVSGKIIRVRRLLISSDETAWFVLKSVSIAAVETEISPRLYSVAGQATLIDVRFGEECPQTARGEGLLLDSNLGGGDIGLWVEYDVVD